MYELYHKSKHNKQERSIHSDNRVLSNMDVMPGMVGCLELLCAPKYLCTLGVGPHGRGGVFLSIQDSKTEMWRSLTDYTYL